MTEIFWESVHKIPVEFAIPKMERILLSSAQPDSPFDSAQGLSRLSLRKSGK
jgi:hypothetical protein